MRRASREHRRKLEAGYRRMARDKAREVGALKWVETLMGDAEKEQQRSVTPSRAGPSGRR
ncbi:MAG: hypothetical protein L6Q95_00820 [Planctomycetes bacterium]|nr:hypothetical protein [Planctomycetota bacterium]